MKRRFFKRATALLLALVTAMSLVTVSFAGQTTTGQGSQGNDGGGSQAGTFNCGAFAYRIYAFDANTGEIVTNVVDFYNDKVPSAESKRVLDWVLAGSKNKVTIYKTPKLEGMASFKFYPQSQVPNIKSSNGNLWMRPIENGKPMRANGDAVKRWMLTASGKIGNYNDSGWSSGGGSGSGSNYTGGTTGIPNPNPGQSAVNFQSLYNMIDEICTNPGKSLEAYYYGGYSTQSEATVNAVRNLSWIGQTVNYCDKLTDSEKSFLRVKISNAGTAIQTAAKSSTYNWPSSAQVSMLKDLMAKINNVYIQGPTGANWQSYQRLYDSTYPKLTAIQKAKVTQKLNDIQKLDAGDFIDGIFNTSYAASDSADIDSGNLFPILNTADGSADNYIFSFTNGVALEESSSGAGDAITYTCWKNNYNIAVEPVYWFRPAKVGHPEIHANAWFYGTPTNYAEWAVAAKRDRIFDDGGRGGHYQNTNNKVGAGCLILNEPDDDLVFTDSTKNITHVAAPTSPLPNTVLMDRSKGYAMHWYTFSGETGVPTYDKDEGDTPHPAPDPTIPDPTGDNYNVNIVKVYDYQHEDGTIEHVTTTLKTQEPGWIQIQHEPTYKVIAYFTSNSLYNPVVSGTTWEDVNTVPVITGSEFSWSTVKNKPAGTNADTIKISKSAPEGSSESNATNLYVRLLKTDVTTQVDYGANVISESQLNKVIGTDKRFGDDATQSKTWGDYLFTMTLDAVSDHNYYCGTPLCLSCPHTCTVNYNDTAVITYSVGQTASAVETQSKSTAASVFKPVIKTKLNNSTTEYAVSGKGGFSWDNGPEYNNDDGVAQFTTIWRGCVDTVTLAKYKKSDMTGYSNLTTLFATANSNPAKRATGSMYTKPITLAINGTASTVKIEHSYCDDKYVAPTIDPQANDFTGTVKIFCYAGKAHGLSSTTVGTIENATSGNFKISVFNKKCETTLKFNPYIRMSFQYTQDGYDTTQYNTEGAKLFKPLAQPGNTFNGALGTYLKDRTAYVLSDKQSSILPTNAIEVGWYNPTQTSGKYGLQMTSQQWSIHNRATNGSEWRKPNQVLPGGAMYQLNTTGTETTLRAITYSAMVNPTDTWIDGATANEYSAAQVTKNNNEFIEQYRDIVENYKVVQWVNKDWSLNMPWDNNNAVKIERGGESLSKLGLSTKASTDSKYLLFAGNSGNGASEGDIDILSESYVVTMYKIFTDSEGNVYFAKQQSSPSKTPATEDTFSGLMTQLANTNGTNPTGAILLGTRTQNVDQVMASIQTSNNEVYQVDQKTGAVRNVLNAISRNRGNDENAAWVTDNKWYNEAFDGYYVAMQTMTYKVGFKDPSRRVSVLDPNLCPAKSSTSNIFTSAHVSAFRLNDKSDSAKASGKGSGYMGTFFGIDAFMPDVENMFYTRPFYIPNANVQDLD